MALYSRFEDLTQLGRYISSSNDNDLLGSRFESEESVRRDPEMGSRDLLLRRPDGSSSGSESDIGCLDGVRLSVGLSEVVGRGELDDGGREQLSVSLDSVDAFSSVVGLDYTDLSSDLEVEEVHQFSIQGTRERESWGGNGRTS